MTKLINPLREYEELDPEDRGFWYREPDGKLKWMKGLIEEGTSEGDNDFFYFDDNGSKMQMTAEFVKIGGPEETEVGTDLPMSVGYISREVREKEDEEEEEKKKGKLRFRPPRLRH